MHSPRPETERSEISIVAASVMLIAVVGIGIVLRSWGIDADSWSTDEYYDLRLIKKPLIEVLTWHDGFPPLYHALLRYWVGFWGTEDSGRWFSVLWGVATIPVMYDTGRLCVDRRVGLATAFFTSIAPIHVHYSQECRAYAFLTCLSAVTIWSWLRVCQKNRIGDWGIFLASCVLGAYTHYFFPLLPFSLGGLALGFEASRHEHFRTRLVAAVVMTSLLCLPLIPLMRLDLGTQVNYVGQSGFGLLPWGFTYFSFLVGPSLGPSARQMHELRGTEALWLFLPYLVVLAVAALGLAWNAAKPLMTSRHGRSMLFLAFAPVPLLGVVGNLAQVGYNTRYALWCTLPLAICLAYAFAGRDSRVSHAMRRMRIVAVILYVGLAVLSIYNRHHRDQYRTEDMRSVADYLQHCEPNVPVFVVSGFMCLPLDYYCGASREIYAVNDVVGNRESLDRVLAAMRELAGHGGRYLVVYSREFYGDPDALLLTALDHTGSVRQVFKAPGVVVYHGKFAMPVAID